MTLTRKTRSKISLAVIAAATLGAGFYSVPAAHGATLVQWTFENLALAGGTAANQSVTATSVGPFAPDFTAGSITASATATHATASQFSTPAGNGSNRSLSANTWAVNDFYEFDINTTGLSGLTLNFDATGSSTGPRDFKVQTTTGGGVWIDLAGGAYAIPTTTNSTGGTTVIGWSPTTTSTSTTFTFDLSGIASLAGVRLVDVDTTSVTGGTVATGGTSRIDNVTFSGTAVAAPEPATAGIIAAGAAFIVGRRRRR